MTIAELIAVVENMAAAAPAIARMIIATAKFGAIAVPRLARTKMTSPVSNNLFRETPEANAAITGAKAPFVSA